MLPKYYTESLLIIPLSFKNHNPKSSQMHEYSLNVN
nr:MAG TPA: hypothetical protein [Caudoviricetes sp.]DAL26699.1 MAG TPA_asm: hypothetical protein [Caudoviricetes sp.]